MRKPPLDPPPFPIWDVHVHLGVSDTGQLYYPTLEASEYQELMDASGIQRAAVFPPQMESGYATANTNLRDLRKQDPERWLAFARLGGRSIPLTKRQLWMARRKARFLLLGAPEPLSSPKALADFDGVKLAPHLDGLPGSDYIAEINRLGLPVLVHGGEHTPPAWIEHALLPLLEVPLIIAHLGIFPAAEHLLDAALELAKTRRNVYLDTSGVWFAEFIRYAAETVPEKILFGSDAPLTHPGVAWRQVASVVENDAVLEGIAHKNAQRLFRKE